MTPGSEVITEDIGAFGMTCSRIHSESRSTRVKRMGTEMELGHDPDERTSGIASLGFQAATRSSAGMHSSRRAFTASASKASMNPASSTASSYPPMPCWNTRPRYFSFAAS